MNSSQSALLFFKIIIPSTLRKSNLMALISKNPFHEILPGCRVPKPFFIFDRKGWEVFHDRCCEQARSLTGGSGWNDDLCIPDAATRRPSLENKSAKVKMRKLQDLTTRPLRQPLRMVDSRSYRHKPRYITIADQVHRFSRYGKA